MNMEKELNSINFEILDKDIDILLSNISEANELYKQIENTLEELGGINNKFEEQDKLLKNINDQNIDAINKNSEASLLKIAELIQENSQLPKKIDDNFSNTNDVLNNKFEEQDSLLKNINDQNIDAINQNSEASLLKIAELVQENSQLHKKIDNNFSNTNDVLNNKFEEQYSLLKKINDQNIDAINKNSEASLLKIAELVQENSQLHKKIDNIEQKNVDRQNSLDKKLNILLGLVIVVVIVTIALNIGTV